MEGVKGASIFPTLVCKYSIVVVVKYSKQICQKSLVSGSREKRYGSHRGSFLAQRLIFGTEIKLNPQFSSSSVVDNTV